MLVAICAYVCMYVRMSVCVYICRPNVVCRWALFCLPTSLHMSFSLYPCFCLFDLAYCAFFSRYWCNACHSTTVVGSNTQRKCCRGQRFRCHCGTSVQLLLISEHVDKEWSDHLGAPDGVWRITKHCHWGVEDLWPKHDLVWVQSGPVHMHHSWESDNQHLTHPRWVHEVNK